ncbi:MAG: PAS domain-containing protein, partial [Sulfurovum sp.]|nr:PAS domain-containing protein [Sulfurovaceae bacterium]
ELIDAPHSRIRHPDMPKLIFGHLWDRAKSGEDVYLFIKNLSKDGSFYWVYAHVRVAKNPDGSFRNYVSTRRTMNPNARPIIEEVYKKLKNDDNIEILKEFCESRGESLDKFNDVMIALQDS